MRAGATLGILGGGQLGLMLGRAAHGLGLRTAVLDPDPACAARRACDAFVQGAWSDAAKAVELARAADVVTVETEHIAADALRAVEAVRPLRPGAAVVTTVHDRLRQKGFLASRGLPQPPFLAVADAAGLQQAVADLGLPLVLKSRAGGYDGRGQAVVRQAGEAEAAWRSLGARPCIAEAFVDFARELSVVLARDGSGAVAACPVAENVHVAGILHTTMAPAAVPDAVAREAVALAGRIADALGHVGVMAVEMFHLRDGGLMVNEVAPRVHNSGHYTLDACQTSQFEQHVRAVMGLPLGPARPLRPAAMLNLLGDLWGKGEPDWSRVRRHPEARLHLYGKAPRPGRKLGHVTVLGETPQQALALAQRIHAELSGA